MITLALRALGSRLITAVVLFVLTTVAVATAALGPLLIRAADQSALADTVADAAPADILMKVSVALEPGTAYQESRQQVVLPFDGLDTQRWQPPVVTVVSTQNILWGVRGGTADPTYSRVLAAETDCAGIVLTSGRCPVYPGETLIADTDADRAGVDPDAVLTYRDTANRSAALRVVGSYDAARSLPGLLVRPAGGGPAADRGAGPGVDGPPTGDTLVVTAAQLFRLNLTATVTGSAALGPQLRVSDVPAVRSTLAVVTDGAAHAVPGRVLFFASLVGPVLDRAARLSADAAAVIAMTVVQALAVAFFALAIVVQRVGQARAAEWGIGRLRGIPRRRWLAGILIEPAVPLVLGLPAGLAAAALVGRGVVAATLRAGTPVEPGRWPVLVAGGVAFLGAVAALAVVGAVAIRRPVVELIQQSAERRALSRVALAGQAVVVLLAAAAVYQLLTGGTLTAGGSQLALLAPALLALAIAVLAVRAGVLAVRRLVARPPRSRIGLLVGRPLGRTPSSVNPAVVIAVGLAVTVFASQVASLSARNQELRAEAGVGAARVLTVQVPASTTLLDAVQTADPSGRYAMAAVETDPSVSTGTARVIAVDSSRYAAVASWPVVGVERLRSSTTAPVVLRGRSLTVQLEQVTVTRQVGSVDGAPVEGISLEPVSLQVVAATSAGWVGFDLGEVKTGTTTLTGVMEGCVEGCRLVALRFQSNFGTAFDVAATVTSVRTDEQPTDAFAAALQGPGWHSFTEPPGQTTGSTDAASTVRSAADGVQVIGHDGLGVGYVGARPGDTQDPMPVILGTRTPVVPVPDQSGVLLGNGLDGQATRLQPVGAATVLPRSLSDGVLVDLQNATGNADASFGQGISEVWLAADAPASVLTALQAAGVRVQSEESVADAAAALQRQPPTRGATIAVALGYAALALALVTLLATRLADLGRRRRVWRSLGEAGLGRGLRRRLAVVEIGAPALSAVVVGVVAGTLAVRLAAPRLPLVDRLLDGPPLELQLTWGSVGVVAGVAVLLVVIIAAVVAVIEVGRDSSTRQENRR